MMRAFEEVEVDTETLGEGEVEGELVALTVPMLVELEDSEDALFEGAVGRSLVRSNENDPASRCCSISAKGSGAGTVIPKAQMSC